MASDEGPALVRGMWTAMALAVVIVTLRIIAKIKIRNFGIDDALMIIALVCFAYFPSLWAAKVSFLTLDVQSLSISSTAVLTMSVNRGFGKDLLTLSDVDQMHVLKAIAIQVPLVTFSTTTARTSFVLYLLRILSTNKKYRMALWAAMLLQLASNIVSAVLPLSICRNAAILWDINTKTTCGNITAVVKFSYFSSCQFPAPIFLSLPRG
jgi:hypothetical protein